MKNSTFLLEKIKYKEAINYASNLAGISLNGIVSIDELPDSIPHLVKEITSISSIPVAKLAADVPIDELTSWVIKLIGESDSTRLFFKPNELYWKFWVDVYIIDVKSFIKNYLLTSKVKDFYVSDINGRIIKAFLNEEYSFDFFVSEYRN